MTEPTLEERAEAISTANSWERIAVANISVFERYGADYDGAIPPHVAAEIARDALREAGLYQRAAEIVTPEVNYQQ